LLRGADGVGLATGVDRVGLVTRACGVGIMEVTVWGRGKEGD